MAKTKKKLHKYRKPIRLFWTLVGGSLFSVLLLFLLASWGIFGKLPDETLLENPEKDLATEIISEDGQVIGKFYKENRTPVSFEELPDHLVNALIATEDVRFYKHSGIDARGTLRAFAFLGKRGGASTLSQQLAKLFFTERPSRRLHERVIQKIKEWIIATRLERRYTKEEILTMYVNEYDFLNQAVGIESAANIYFDKPPTALSTVEAATLVGMFKNSALYNPLKNPQGVTNRRNVVLSQMEKYGFLSQEIKDSLQALPLEIKYTPQGHDEGIATYFREYVRHFMEDWKRENPKPDGTLFNIYRDGLRIYTTLDSRMQQYAETAVTEHMPNLQKEFDRQNKYNTIAPFRDITKEEISKIMNNAMRQTDRWREMQAQGKTEADIIASFSTKTKMRLFTWQGERDTVMTPLDSIRYYKAMLRASFMAMNPQTGFVKAWVGGTNYKHFKYDMVKKGKRQIGSTFKPFVYATAIDQLHMSPCDSLPNVQYCIPKLKHGNMKEWCPKNSSDKYGGKLTLTDALAKSINTVTAQLIDRIGPKPVLELARKMGLDTEKIPEVPSIALGTPDVTLYEMVSAYSTFANAGVYVKPVMIERIEDKHGTILYQYKPETRDVISSETAYVTVNLLEGVSKTGSGARLRHTYGKNDVVYKSTVTGYPYEFDNPIAGKTGTTQNNSDGWFMGMVPNLAAGVWVGGEDRATHFSYTAYGQGATMALPIWALFMKQCYADESLSVSKEAFPRPDFVSIETNCEQAQTNTSGDTTETEEFEF